MARPDYAQIWAGTDWSEVETTFRLETDAHLLFVNITCLCNRFTEERGQGGGSLEMIILLLLSSLLCV